MDEFSRFQAHLRSSNAEGGVSPSVPAADDEAIQDRVSTQGEGVDFDGESLNVFRGRSYPPISHSDTFGGRWEITSQPHIPTRLQRQRPTDSGTNLPNLGPASVHDDAIQRTLPKLGREKSQSPKNALGETSETIDSSLLLTPWESKTGSTGADEEFDEEWPCLLCDFVTKTRFVLKRHLNDLHYSPWFYLCPERGCDVVADGQHQIKEHVCRSHDRQASHSEIDSCRQWRSRPPFCPVCSRLTDSWNHFYECLLGHSRAKWAERIWAERTEAFGLDSSSNSAALALPKPGMRRLTETRETSHISLKSPTPGSSSFSQLLQLLQPEKAAQNSTEGAPNLNSADRSPLRRLKATEKRQALSQSDEFVAQRARERRHVHGNVDYRNVTNPLRDSMRRAEHANESKGTRTSSSWLKRSIKGDFSQTPHQDNGRKSALRGTSSLSESSSIPRSEDRSSTSSMETAITSPEEDEEDIDAGIPDNGDMEHILCPVTYYGKLDMLEAKTAELCGIRQGPKVQDGPLSECLRVFGGVSDALRNLHAEGFCGSVMSIFVEDQSRADVANTVHIALHEIARLVIWCDQPVFMPNLLIRFCSEMVRKLVGDSFLDQYPESSSSELVCCRFLSTVLSIGVVSFSGSHVCRFDQNLWGQEMNEISVGCGYSFFPRQLACLKDFIGGPAWVLCKSRPQAERKRLKVSLMVQDLQELWGPVWLNSGTPEAGLAVRTERGYIVPLPCQTTSQVDEIECHWAKESPGRINREQPILLSSTSRILIGTDSGITTGLTHNLDCQSDIARIQAHIHHQLPIAGTCKEHVTGGDYEVQMTGGQFVNVSLVKKFKRYPMRTRKMSLIEECKNPKVKLIPLLKLRIGLEVSACTGNAQRVTLWDALRLSQKRPCHPGRVSYCDHEVADKNCIRSCWTRCSPTDDVDSDVNIPRESSKMGTADVRRLIIDAIIALEHTGIDHEGNLQACWPFTDIRRTRCIKRSTGNESNNWLRAVEDTREVATFAVVSQRCLEFQHSVLSRPCSITCRPNIRKIKNVLSTRILLSPSIELSCKKTVPDCSEPGVPLCHERLSPGDTFVVGEAVLAIKKIVPGRQSVVIATSVNNPVQSRMTKALVGWKAPKYCEDADPELALGLSVVALVIY